MCFILSVDEIVIYHFFFFQAEDGIRDRTVTGVQTCALPICTEWRAAEWPGRPARSHPAWPDASTPDRRSDTLGRRASDRSHLRESARATPASRAGCRRTARRNPTRRTFRPRRPPALRHAATGI